MMIALFVKNKLDFNDDTLLKHSTSKAFFLFFYFIIPRLIRNDNIVISFIELGQQKNFF